MADTREESSEESSDSTSSDNFSIYTETSSSEQDLRNLARTSTLSTTTLNSRKGNWIEIIFEIADCEKVQASCKQSKRRSNGGIDLVEQLFFAGKAYLKINSLVKTPLHEFMAVERSGLWAPDFARDVLVKSFCSMRVFKLFSRSIYYIPGVCYTSRWTVRQEYRSELSLYSQRWWKFKGL